MVTALENAEETLAKVAGIPAADLQNVPAVPPFINSVIHDYAQKLLTAGSVWLLAHGANNFTNKADLEAFGLGVVGFAVSCVWTLGVAFLREKKMISLFNATPPK